MLLAVFGVLRGPNTGRRSRAHSRPGMAAGSFGKWLLSDLCLQGPLLATLCPILLEVSFGPSWHRTFGLTGCTRRAFCEHHLHHGTKLIYRRFPAGNNRRFCWFLTVLGRALSIQCPSPVRALRALIGAPELHDWYHSRERHAGNHANISPVLDIVFGTYRGPRHEPEAFGVTESIPKRYLGYLVYPFHRGESDDLSSSP